MKGDGGNCPLEDVFDTALENTSGDRVSIAGLFHAFGDRTFGPVLIVLGLFALSPIGAIPGVPAVIGVIVVLIAGQLAAGRSHLWLPRRLNSLDFDRDRVARVRRKAGPWLRRIDHVITERMDWMTGTTARRLAALACIGLGVLMIPLEIVPFAVALPAAAVVMFGLALTSRDGLVMLLAAGVTLASLYFGIRWLA